MPVELQIRSKIQHSWATAVEVVGTFTKQSLKSSYGDSEWLDFFKYASVEFAKLEGYPCDEKFKDEDTFKKLDNYVKSLDLYVRLNAFKVAIDKLGGNKKNGDYYYILRLDLKESKIRIYGYKKTDLTQATAFYDDEEKKFENDPSKDLVLVSAESLADLKKAYPNYFSDTDEFTKNIKKVYSQNKKMDEISKLGKFISNMSDELMGKK